MKRVDDTRSVARERGPRGGKTTISKSGAMVRKTVWIDCDVDDALREIAHQKRLTEAQILRQLLRESLGIE